VKNPDEIGQYLRQVQNKSQFPLWELSLPEDHKIHFRVDEKISPAMFKPDPLFPGGYLANSLTLRAMKPMLFVAGSDLDELTNMTNCRCGKDWDQQFWSLCPYCGDGA